LWQAVHFFKGAANASLNHESEIDRSDLTKRSHLNVANIIWGSKNGFTCPSIIFVDNNIDPTNMDEVLHALATKVIL